MAPHPILGTAARALGVKAWLPVAGGSSRGGRALYPSGSPGARISGSSAKTTLAAYGGDNAVDWAMDCVRLIMESASGAEYGFEKDSEKLLSRPDPLAPEETKMAPEDLLRLFRSPTPWTTYTDMVELIIIDLLLTGNAYLAKHRADGQGRPLALYRMAPPLVDIKPGTTDLIKHYEYRVPGNPAPAIFKPEEVVHIKLPNPHSPYFGLSIIAGSPRVFDTELALTESQAQYFEQGTRLSGVLTTERNVNDRVFNRVQRQFQALYSGQKNAYKTAVLENGLDFKPIQGTAVEAQFEILTKMSRDRIFAMFRCPAPLLGVMEYANYKVADAQRIFDTKTMPPILTRIEAKLSEEITQPGWGLDFRIYNDYVMPEEDRLDLAGTFAKLPGVKVREVREKVGLEPLGDERDDIVLNLPGEDMDENGEGGNADQPLPGEAGRPPKGENTRAIPLPKGAAARAKAQDKAWDTILEEVTNG